MADLTNKWYQAIRISPDDLDEEDDEEDDGASVAASERSTNILVDNGNVRGAKQHKSSAGESSSRPINSWFQECSSLYNTSLDVGVEAFL